MVLFPYVLIYIAYWMRDNGKPPWSIRKLIHTSGLTIVGIYVSFLETLNEILSVMILFLISLFVLTIIPQIRLFFTLIEMGTRKGEKEIESIINTSLTSLGMIILLFTFFDTKWIFLSGLLSVALGDGLGEFIGKPFGKHKYKIVAPKSIEGSIGVFIGTFMGVIFAYFALSKHTADIQDIIILIIASLIAMILEAISKSFMDNVIMPWAVSGILWYFI